MKQLASLGLVAILVAAGCRADVDPPAGSKEHVGRTPDGMMTPVNQRVTPYGRVIELPGLRPQAIALSPDGKLLAVSGGTTELLVLNAESGAIRQRVPLPRGVAPLPPDEDPQVSFTGLIFSGDGRRIFLSDVTGSIKVFHVAEDGAVSAAASLPLAPANAPRRKEEIPSGLALSSDGSRLYVCGNLSNRLLEIDPASARLLRSWDAGVAPYDVVLTGGKAYVSNWGGRRAGAGDPTGPAGRGTVVRVDPLRRIACEGSVTVVDLSGAAPPREVLTGLHASALAASPDGRYVVCANASADTLSAIDTRTGEVAETIWARARPNDLFGAEPNALAFSPDGRTLCVANGGQNAVGVVDFDPSRHKSRLTGLVPVGWFPCALAYDARRGALCVANLKGLPAAPRKNPDGQVGYNSHVASGSLSIFALPPDRDLPALSDAVDRGLRSDAIAASRLPPRRGQPPRPVPERIGEPSVFKHVVYIIKENRTYDQVLGDMPEGNGDARLCVFGERITPNLHKLARTFCLLDNTYCAGILSADGHQWSTTSATTDYMEKSFAGFPRSYPDGMGEDECDALAYSPAGFLWDNAAAHGVQVRDYGEFMEPKVRWKDPSRKGEPGFLDCFRAWKGQSDEVLFGSEPTVEGLRPHAVRGTVGWSLAVPDQFRADFFLREWREMAAKGDLPGLVIICLPNDHTSGAREGSPTPGAQVADNDLAMGRIVEGISHSVAWRETCIFAIEDDPQSGWDHVSGYRTTAYVASAWTRRGTVIGTQYNTTSVIRTIEQILGLPPMNQFDASATLMSDCFAEAPDERPFEAVPSAVALDEMNPRRHGLLDPQLRLDAEESARMDFRAMDRAPEDALNRILWRAMKGTKEPYPAWATAADEER